MEDRFRLRAFNTRTKEMIYINDFYWFEENFVRKNCDEGWILSQCLGLKDCNSKLVYEGDILKVVDNGGYDVLMFVEYHKEMASFILIPKIGYSMTFDECCSTPKLRELVGNIYENQELFEG